MKKEYQKPEVDFVSLMVQEQLMTGEGLPGGTTDVESNDLFD